MPKRFRPAQFQNNINLWTCYYKRIRNCARESFKKIVDRHRNANGRGRKMKEKKEEQEEKREEAERMQRQNIPADRPESADSRGGCGKRRESRPARKPTAIPTVFS